MTYVATLLNAKGFQLSYDDWYLKGHIQRVLFYRECRDHVETYYIPERTKSIRFLERIGGNDARPAGDHLIVQEQTIWMADVLSLDYKPVALDFDPPQEFIDLLRETARLDAYYYLQQARERMYSMFEDYYKKTKNHLDSSIGNKQGVRLPNLKPMTLPFLNYKNQQENWVKIDDELVGYLRQSRADQRRRRK